MGIISMDDPTRWEFDIDTPLTGGMAHDWVSGNDGSAAALIEVMPIECFSNESGIIDRAGMSFLNPHEISLGLGDDLHGLGKRLPQPHATVIQVQSHYPQRSYISSACFRDKERYD